jgi:hypothetical protein
VGQVTGPLRIHLRTTVPEVDLADYLPSVGEEVVQHQQTADGRDRLTVSMSDGSTRSLTRFRRDGDAWVALDITRFHIGPSTFAETERYRSEPGENLHTQPIVLPRRLRVGAWQRPVPGGKVCLAAAGMASLDLPEGPSQVLSVVALLATDGRTRRLQWLAQGLGEVAIGAPNGPLDWWMVGARCGTLSWLSGVPDALGALPRQPLPATAPGATAGLL